MLRDIRAELAKQARRPACWLLLAVAVLLSVTFGYVIPYLIAGSARVPGPGRDVTAMLPGSFVGTALGGMPVFIGALALIYGVFVAGSEYGFGTWKTVLVQQPSRLTVYTAKLTTLAAGTLLLVGTLLATSAAASSVVAVLEGHPLAWPGPGEIAAGAGAGWLITTMWASLGVALAIVSRSVALPIGLGLVWLLAVQNLIAGIAAPTAGWLGALREGLPGANAGSLAGALGAPAGTPGVADIAGAAQAGAVVSIYLVVFCVVGGWLLRRRDLG